MKALALFRRPRGPVVYEVRLEIDPAILGEFDDWLVGHVREMLAFPGFDAATVYRGNELTESHCAVRLVAYEVRSRRELDSYLHTHAASMRKDGIDRFGKRFSATRRILPGAEWSLPDGFAPLFDRQQISGGLPVCANCHQPVPGRFCVHCGQEDRTFILSLGELLDDLVGSLFNYDSRFFRTVRELLFRPGWVTVAYVRGRRQQYLPPVRLYIFASLIFFFVATLSAEQEFDEDLASATGESAEVVEEADQLSPEQRADVERRLREAEAAAGMPAGTLKVPEKDAGNAEEEEAGGNDINFSLGSLGSDELEERLERGVEAVRDNPKAFVQALLQQIPTMLLLFLPVIALLLKVLYITTGRYYVEHLVFTLHYHSAAFILLLLWLLYGEITWAPLQALSGWVSAAVWLYLPFYLYKSLRRVYGQGRFLTILKYAFLVLAYIVSLSVTLAATVMYTIYQQS